MVENKGDLSKFYKESNRNRSFSCLELEYEKIGKINVVPKLR